MFIGNIFQKIFLIFKVDKCSSATILNVGIPPGHIAGAEHTN